MVEYSLGCVSIANNEILSVVVVVSVVVVSVLDVDKGVVASVYGEVYAIGGGVEVFEGSQGGRFGLETVLPRVFKQTRSFPTLHPFPKQNPCDWGSREGVNLVGSPHWILKVDSNKSPMLLTSSLLTPNPSAA